MLPSTAEQAASLVWEARYRLKGEDGAGDATIEDTWRRVAQGIAAAEPRDPHGWARRFLELLEGFRFLPGGRILAGAGTSREVTLFNCFVMGVVDDSLEGIFRALEESARTLQQGGGIGLDFSTLRPRGSIAQRTGARASGPVSFMRLWNAMSDTLLAENARGGAMMATLRCDHPDVLDFVDAKNEPGSLRHLNQSLLVTDELLRAVATDQSWPLVFPCGPHDRSGEVVPRRWSGAAAPVPCRVWRRLPARALWERVMESAWRRAEPGVLFVDTINRLNNLGYVEHLTATNPCGELPLPPHGACDLGSLNLVAFVAEPFSSHARLDLAALADAAATAVRFLDDVIDVSHFPLEVQRDQARRTRRVGLGVTGLADALAMLGLHYGHVAAREFAQTVMRTLRDAAYRASCAVAAEKGSFPALEAEHFLAGPYAQRLPDDVRAAIGSTGLRNAQLLAIAPAGTISLLAGNVSSGIEPIFDLRATRRLGDGRTLVVDDPAWVAARARGLGKIPPSLVTAQELTAEQHLAMQAAVQPFVDGAISKTVNVPVDTPLAEFEPLYLEAHALGLKGCTVYRPNDITGVVLEGASDRARCCTMELDTGG